MNAQTETQEEQKTLVQTVSDFLVQQPDFFEQHPQLLTQLELPHQSGQTVSLIERQVKRLREEAQQHQHHLAELIAVAKENELLNRRLHRLTLTLIEAATFDEVINALEDKLHDDFRADAVEIHLFSPAESERSNNPEMDDFRPFIELDAPRCGPLPAAQLETLFGPQAEDIRSTALIPLAGTGLLGLLAFGSNDEQRFHPDMGTDYLTRLGEVVSKTLEVVSEPGI